MAVILTSVNATAGKWLPGQTTLPLRCWRRPRTPAPANGPRRTARLVEGLRRPLPLHCHPLVMRQFASKRLCRPGSYRKCNDMMVYLYKLAAFVRDGLNYAPLRYHMCARTKAHHKHHGNCVSYLPPTGVVLFTRLKQVAWSPNPLLCDYVGRQLIRLICATPS